jgi:hypothetical protein
MHAGDGAMLAMVAAAAEQHVSQDSFKDGQPTSVPQHTVNYCLLDRLCRTRLI